MLFDDIVKSMNGVNDDKTPRCGFAISKENYKIGDTDPVQTFSRIASHPNVQICRIPGYDKTYVKIDIFIDQFSKNDAKMFLSYLNDYGKEINEITDESEFIPQIFCTFVPLAYEGQYYIIASLPLFWSLCASKINGEVDTLSILFDAETVVLYETSEVDYNQIIAIVEGEVEAELAYQDELLEKQELEKEMLANRNNSSPHNNTVVEEQSATDILKGMTQTSNIDVDEDFDDLEDDFE